MKPPWAGYVCWLLIAVPASFVPIPAAAFPELDFSGLADMRLIQSSSVSPTENGGQGIFRYGGNGSSDGLLRFSEASLVARVRLDWDIDLTTQFRSSPEQRTGLDVTETFLRWRPVSISPFRLSMRAGYFFPEISMENVGIGWTSPFTITPSALNAWLGAEIRTLGTEAKVEWRNGQQKASLTLGSFFGNDPAGVVLFRYGFILSDRVTGILDRVRLPSALGRQAFVYPIKIIDDRPGFFAGGSWSPVDSLSLAAQYYDNNADPKASADGIFAWHTRFANVGITADLPEDFEILTQAMTGTTRIQPGGIVRGDVEFDAGYVMLSRKFGDHRLSLRGDLFRVSDVLGHSAFQHGAAGTFAYVVFPADDLRLTLEAGYATSFQPGATGGFVTSLRHQFQIQMSWRYFI